MPDGIRWEQVSHILAEQIRRRRTLHQAVQAMGAAADRFPERAAEYRAGVALLTTGTTSQDGTP
jgi:hypothetical protein